MHKKPKLELELRARSTAIRVFAIMCAAIFAVEFAIMMLFVRHSDISPLVESAIDATLLVVILFPFLHFLILRPMLAKTEDVLARREQSLREAQRIAQLGNWEWDIERNSLEWSDEMYRIFGVKPQAALAPYRLFLGPVAPEDSERVRSAMEDALHNGLPYNVEYRIVRPDGTRRWVHEQAELTVGAAGEPRRMVGTVHDITDVKQAEELARESELRLRSVIENVASGIVTVGADGEIETFNAAAERIFMYAADEVIGKHMNMLLPPEYRHSHDAQVDFYLRSGRPSVIGIMGREVFGLRKDGSTFPLEISVTEMASAGKRRFVAIINDITERKEAERQIHYMAHYDGLTGLPNRALFLDRLDQAVSQARRKKTSFAVFFLDLDGFKEVNDTAGHRVGDAVLREVGARLNECVRDTDTVARIGGDEFTIILTNLERAEDAAGVARPVIDALARPFAVGGQRYGIGCSIGISIYPDDARDGDALIAHADGAMYHAKASGKNNYRFYRGDSAA